MKQLKNKKTILFAGLSAFILVFVGSLAYNKDLFSFANLFHLGGDVVEFVETFDSPDNWTPCTTTPKTAIATNKNNSPRYVRMKINEYWRTSDTTTPESDHETSDLPLTWDDNGTEKHYAVINTQNDDKWELKSDGWYYYKTTLGQDESTLSLLESVTFNCEVNTAGEVRYSVDGKSSESIPTEYGGAKYHLYITFQMSAEPMGPVQHTANCGNPTILYDIIACQTNGPDDNVDFTARASSTVDNYNGVNTISSSKDDLFPIYYFRGEVANNYLEFNGFCWRLVRTAENGGVKMIYAGEKDSNGCIDTSALAQAGSDKVVWIGSGEFNSVWNETYLLRYEMAHAGYMFDGEKYYDVAGNSMGGHFAGTDANWDGTKYVLVSPERVGNPFSTGGHNYVCYDPSNPSDFSSECETVLYYSAYYNNTYYGILLSGGAKWEDALAEMQANTKSSNAKTAIDTWYDANITSGRNHIETSVTYCNDRSGQFVASDGFYSYVFGSYSRIRGADGVSTKPSMACRKNDAFSTDSTTGNGALSKPVALLSADEYMLAGFCLVGEASHSYATTQRCHGAGGGSNYLDSYYEAWTMSPLAHDGNNTDMAVADNFTWMNHDSAGGVNNVYRPALALKFDTVVRGSGTATDPYTISE